MAHPNVDTGLDPPDHPGREARLPLDLIESKPLRFPPLLEPLP
jgi:hypothetical protein